MHKYLITWFEHIVLVWIHSLYRTGRDKIKINGNLYENKHFSGWYLLWFDLYFMQFEIKIVYIFTTHLQYFVFSQVLIKIYLYIDLPSKKLDLSFNNMYRIPQMWGINGVFKYIFDVFKVYIELYFNQHIT